MQGVTPKSFVFAALLRASAFLTLLFAACIGLIRAQPYDDSHLRAFLTPPDGCPMPCFMGIRPGVTTMGEARDILEAHEWVEDVTMRFDATGLPSEILWTWSDTAPEFADERNAAHLLLRNNTVYNMYLFTDIHAGSIRLLLSKPEHTSIRLAGPTLSLRFDFGYPALSLVAVGIVPCPVQVNHLWQASVDLRLSGDFNTMFFDSGRDLSDWSEFHLCTR
jgi:hypothetical protein